MPLVSKSFSDIITFSRGTNATYFDSAGVLKYAPNNAIRNSTMVNAAAGTPGTAPTNWTLTSGGGVTREIVGVGAESGITYIDVRFSAASGINFFVIPELATQVAALSGQSWTSSFYIQLVGGSLTNLTIDHNLQENSAAGAFLAATIVQFTPTNAALVGQRYSISRTLNNASTAFLQNYIRGVASGAYDITLRIGLPQLEIGDTVGPAIPTSGTAYYGPRFDYNPATLAAQGLLIEEQRTNTAYPSITPAATTGTMLIGTGIATTVANAAVAPDGTTTATSYTSVQGNINSSAGSSIRHLNGVTVAGTYTVSFFAKANTGGFSVVVRFVDAGASLDTSVTCSATDGGNNIITTQWRRYYATITLGAGSTGFYSIFNFASNSDTTYVWGAQLEAGAFPTSYIPTTVAQATRQPDVASVNTLSPWFNASEGTIYSDFAGRVSGTQPYMSMLANTGETERIYQRYVSGQYQSFVRIANVDSLGVYNSSESSAVNAKIATAYNSSQLAVSTNGQAVTGAAVTSVSGVPSGLNKLWLGSFAGSSSFANGYLRRITYYPRRLSNAELVAITSA